MNPTEENICLQDTFLISVDEMSIWRNDKAKAALGHLDQSKGLKCKEKFTKGFSKKWSEIKKEKLSLSQQTHHCTVSTPFISPNKHHYHFP